MRTSVVLGAAGLALVLTACGPESQVGKLFDPGAEATAAIGEALDDLAAQPVVLVDVAIDAISRTEQSGTLDMMVTGTGFGYGTGTVADADAELLAMDGSLFLTGDRSMWTDRWVHPTIAKKFDDHWVQANPTDWFDPGSGLTPSECSKALRTALENYGALDTVLPEPRDVDGTSVYPISVHEGYVAISVESPHRVVAVEDMAVRLSSNESPQVDAMLDLPSGATVPAERIAEFTEDITAEVDDLDTIYDEVSDIQLTTVGEPTFSCEGMSCTFSLEVETLLAGKYHTATKGKVYIEVAVDGGGLGTKTCTGNKKVTFGESVTVGCTVSFTGTGSFEVRATGQVIGALVSYRADHDELTALLADGLAELPTEA